MKKIYSLFATILLSITCVGSVSGCFLRTDLFSKNKNQLSMDETNKVINFASVASRAGILSTIDGLDPDYVMDYYGNKKVSTLFPRFFKKWAKNKHPIEANTTIYQELKLLFGANGNSDFTNKGDQGKINFTGTDRPYTDSQLSNINMIKQVILVLSGGFEFSAVGQLSQVLSSHIFTSIIQSLGKFSDMMTPDLLNGLSDAFKISSLLPTKNNIEDLAEAMKVLYANFLNNLRKKPDPFASEDPEKILTPTNLITADHLIATSLIDFLKGNSAVNNTNVLKNKHGIGEILHLVILLTCYIEQFNTGDGHNGPTLHLQDKDIKDSNHLFQVNRTNFQVLQAMTTKNYHCDLESGLSLKVALGELNLFFASDAQHDPHGYNMEKLMVILFANKPLGDPVVNYNGHGRSFPQLKMDYKNNPAWGLDQIWIPTYLGPLEYIKNLVLEKAPPLLKKMLEQFLAQFIRELGAVIYTLPYDIATNRPSLKHFTNYIANEKYNMQTGKYDLDGGIIKSLTDNRLWRLLKMFQPKLYHQITAYLEQAEKVVFQLNNYRSNLPNANNHGIWQDIYKGDLLPFLFQEVNKIAGQTIISDKISQILPNLQNPFNEKIATLYYQLTHKHLTPFLYVTKENTLSTMLAFLAKQVGINEQNKYEPYSWGDKHRRTKWLLMHDLFASMGKTADQSIQAAEASGLPSSNFPPLANKDPQQTSTLNYALTYWTQKTKIGGFQSGFRLLGYNPVKSELWKHSMFAELNQIFISGDFFSDFFQITSNLLKKISDGATDEEKLFFLPYLASQNWKTPTNEVHILNTKEICLISFNTYYTDPVLINPTNHQHAQYKITIWLTLSDKKGTSNYTWTKWDLKLIN